MVEELELPIVRARALCAGNEHRASRSGESPATLVPALATPSLFTAIQRSSRLLPSRWFSAPVLNPSSTAFIQTPRSNQGGLLPFEVCSGRLVLVLLAVRMEATLSLKQDVDSHLLVNISSLLL
eukprot:1113237-Pleurochrysis_carterae.AAC.1